MNKILISFFMVLFVLFGNLNAKENYKCDMTCKNHKEMKKNHQKCDMNCSMHKKMDKTHCSIDKKNTKCDCKSGGECTCKGNCKCEISKKNEMKERCGCGMTVESCKKMMPYCEFRDGKKKEL